MRKIFCKMKGLISYNMGLFVVLVLCISLVPYIEKLFIEAYIAGVLDGVTIIRLIGMFAAVVAGYLISNYLGMVSDFKIGTRFEKEVRNRYFLKLIEGRTRLWEEEEQDRHIQALTAEITQLEEDYVTPIVQILQGVLQLVVYAVVIFVLINPYIASGVMILSFLGVIVSRRVKNDASQKRKEYLEANADYIGFIRHMLCGFSAVRQENASHVVRKEEEYVQNNAKKRIRYGKAKAFLYSFNNGISYLTMLFFFAYIVFLAYKNLIDISVAIVSFGYVDLVMEPISTIMESLAAYKSVAHLKIKMEGMLKAEGNVRYVTTPVEEIRAEHILCDRKGKQILKEFSGVFERGYGYLLCGVNGSGKSTLLKILSNLMGRSGGEILINGKSTDENTVFNDLYYIEQQAVVFPVSFEENVTMFGTYDIAYLNRFKFMNLEVMKRIRKCENCEVLSGGEKQLVTLCRALLSGANWLFLDETFSGVSNEIEEHIVSELVSKKYSLIYVTHNFSCEKYFGEKVALM